MNTIYVIEYRHTNKPCLKWHTLSNAYRVKARAEYEVNKIRTYVSINKIPIDVRIGLMKLHGG